MQDEMITKSLTPPPWMEKHLLLDYNALVELYARLSY